MLDANLKSVFRYAKQAIPLLRANGGGAIVTVSSALGLVGGDEDFATHAYAASKAGLIGLTRAMAVTYAREGIRCNVVAPGSTDTEMLRSMWTGPDSSAEVIEGSLDRYRVGIPLRRLAEPADVAAAVVFLVSDEARHITMHDLYVDGGAALRV